MNGDDSRVDEMDAQSNSANNATQSQGLMPNPYLFNKQRTDYFEEDDGDETAQLDDLGRASAVGDFERDPDGMVGFGEEQSMVGRARNNFPPSSCDKYNVPGTGNESSEIAIKDESTMVTKTN